ncbi:Peptidase of plants and bacteria [Carex littledalei]|uniref:Peptidase of plants and bacteria n=1 Tax=Carex littledalei TaxID=544730 RepID=A0A833V7T2_9POAL|nr:Peptidase of plants and bacteria [Carex littledalei]
MKNSHSLVVPLLVMMALFATSYAVQFEATNNAQGTSGGALFDQDIGVDYSKQIMATASDFIWTTFEQAPNDRKSIDLVTLTIVPKLQPDGVVAATSNNEIQYSADYITDSGNVKTNFDGVLTMR